MTHQLTRLLEGLQAYGALVHRLVLRPSLGLLHYLRLLLRRNENSIRTIEEQSAIRLIGSANGKLGGEKDESTRKDVFLRRFYGRARQTR